jgi:ubiquinone/menaquinone biosynthesis C-methylase UbiE
MSRDDPFESKAAAYARYRFDYPKELIAAAFEKVAISAGTRVADLGCGTGFLSRHLVEAGATVYGVEPSAAMRAEAVRALGNSSRFTAIDGSAETTGLPDHSVDVITVGNAFHYFDPGRARTEAERILAAGGRIVLLNHEDPASPSAFMRAYVEFTVRWTPPSLLRAHARTDRRDRLERFFHERRYMREVLFEQEHSLTLDDLQGRFLSTSIAPVSDEPALQTALQELSALYQRYERNSRVPFTLAWTCTSSRWT